MTTSAYPLSWPEGWKRGQTVPHGSAARFKTTYDRTMQRLYRILRLMKATDIVISSNIPLRQDGQPRADVARFRIGDAGVAVYFMRNKKQMVLARDAYDSVYDNLHSIVLALEHLSGLDRHGGAAMMERAFEGFAALPEPGNHGHRRPWWRVFDFQQDPSNVVGGIGRKATLAGCEAAYRTKAKAAHPDRPGGSHDQMAELTAAITKAREVLS